MNIYFAVPILLMCLGLSVTVNIGLTFALFQMRKRVRPPESRPVDGSQLEDLVAHLDSSLETLTARVDELASGQDFRRSSRSVNALFTSARAAGTRTSRHPTVAGTPPNKRLKLTASSCCGNLLFVRSSSQRCSVSAIR